MYATRMGRMRLAAAMLALASIGGFAFAQQEELGHIDFPTTAASPEAQQHFLRGVKLLHSFTFESAEQAFKEASKVEPAFAMAYWGEALSHNHPLLPERNVEAPRSVLKRFGATREARLAKVADARERGFFEAVEILFGEGSEAERGVAYSEAMGRLAERYPDDEEVQAFYAVSLLGTVRHTRDRDFRTRMRAGAIAQNIFRESPDHPGAAHYVIHAFDDPVHAPLALTAALRYAEIAPDAAHALHMPSHIFIQHGMWQRVVASNDASYDSAIRLWLTRDTLSETERFYNDVYVWHALDWGQYGSLQLGDHEKARQAIELLRPVAAGSAAPMATGGVREMSARYVIETEEWEVRPLAADATPAEMLAAGIGAARSGDLAAAQAAEAKLSTLARERTARDGEEAARTIAIMHKEVAALVRLQQGREDEALALMEEATAMAEKMGAPAGAATPLKPAHELHGEILLELGRAGEAMTLFEQSLLRTPNRTLSLRGLARAAAERGDLDTAREAYEKLRSNLSGHPDLPGYQEARNFVSESQ